MRLWTIQPVEVWNMIQETGVYIADPDKAFCHGDKNCTRAYKWMVTQMEKRIGAKPEGVTYPVWAWHTQEYKHKKPDFRHYWNWRSAPSVCLEIEIPDSQVLLSDYNNWHNVLNGWYNDNSMNRDEWEAEREWYRSLNGKEAEKALLESWERIFDVTPFECGDGWRRNACFVQATFWKFHLADVKKVQYLAVR